ncbi:MAG: efflux RND transporter periplasmic adaptor subunit [Myxococcaceae bacterium]
MKRTIISVAVLFMMSACKKAPAPDAADAAAPKSVDAVAPVKVETAEVRHELVPRYMTLTGSISAELASNVAANVSGRVTRTYVERGQSVKKGDILALVDSKAAGFQAAAATAQSKAAESQVKQAEQDCARADTLFAQGAISKADYERQKTGCTSQLYSANAARAQADLAGKLAGDTIIRSPMDGVVGERFVEVGEYVQPPSPVASVYAVGNVKIEISVPEAAVGQVAEGQKLAIEVSAFPDRSFPATIRYVSPALRPQTRDLIIDAIAPNADGALKPGMFASVRLVTGEEQLPTVPVEAIKVDGMVRRMFLAREGQAHELVVRTGTRRDGRIAVLEPLQDGDKVVVRPPPGLRDGSRIQ